MNKAVFQIHYQLKFDFNSDALGIIKSLVHAGIDGLVLNPKLYKISIKEAQEIIDVCGEQVELIIMDDYDFARQINAKVLFLSSLDESTTDLDLAYPNMRVGGRAESLVECKNWELLGADYIDFDPSMNADECNPPFILGSELYQDVIPKKQEYGWMILSLNTPIFSSHIKHLSELTELVDRTLIAGIVISDEFESKLDLALKISGIREIVQ